MWTITVNITWVVSEFGAFLLVIFHAVTSLHHKEMQDNSINLRLSTRSVRSQHIRLDHKMSQLIKESEIQLSISVRFTKLGWRAVKKDNLINTCDQDIRIRINPFTKQHDLATERTLKRIRHMAGTDYWWTARHLTCAEGLQSILIGVLWVGDGT